MIQVLSISVYGLPSGKISTIMQYRQGPDFYANCITHVFTHIGIQFSLTHVCHFYQEWLIYIFLFFFQVGMAPGRKSADVWEKFERSKNRALKLI